MYCNNCGNQIADDQYYCGKCGKAVGKTNEDVKCQNCGSRVEEDTKYCQSCGACLKSELKKRFCKYCGIAFKDEDVFCRNCGQKLDEEGENSIFLSMREKMTYGFTNGSSNMKELFSKTLLDGSPESRLTLGQLIMCALAVLSFAFCFIPSIKMEMPVASFFASEYEEMYISVGNILGDEDMGDAFKEAMDPDEYSSFKGGMTAVSILIFIIPSLGAIVVSSIPLICKTVIKKRRFVIQGLASTALLIGLLIVMSFVKYVAKDINSNIGVGVASAGLTFGGWMYIIVQIGIIAYSVYMAFQNSKIVSDTK